MAGKFRRVLVRMARRVMVSCGGRGKSRFCMSC